MVYITNEGEKAWLRKQGLGYCLKCEAVMIYDYQRMHYVCPNCGWDVDIDDYDTLCPDDYDNVYIVSTADLFRNKPEECVECGSASYPDCLTSCLD